MTDPGMPPDAPPPTFRPNAPAHAGWQPMPGGYGYPQPVERARPIAGLGIATQVLLAVQLIAALALLFPIFHERDLVDRVRSGQGVTIAEAQHADDRLNAMSAIVTVLYLATGIVWIIWFYRARKNVDAWDPVSTRFGAGWAIGGWFCPVVNIWFPYLIAKDVLADTERPPDGPRWATPGRHRSLLLVWWLSYLTLAVLGVVANLYDPDSLDELTTYTSLEIALVLARVVAAALAIAVVRTITKAQNARIAAGPASLQWT